MPKKRPKKRSKIKQNILAIAIAIIFVMFVGYGMETFYDSPKYEDYCDEFAEPVLLEERNTPKNVKKDDCWKEFDAARELYDRNVFIAALIIGTIAIVLGGVILSLESVSSGIMGGGVLTVIYGTMRYWGEMSKYIRFVILGLVLAVLIWIGYKKFKE